MSPFLKPTGHLLVISHCRWCYFNNTFTIFVFHVLIKSCLATLENSPDSIEEELLNLQEKAKLEENLVEQCKNQVTSIFEMFKYDL